MAGPPTAPRNHMTPLVSTVKSFLFTLAQHYPNGPPLPRFSPPLNSRTSSPHRAPIYFLIASAHHFPPNPSLTDATGDPSPRTSTGHLVRSSSNGTPHRNSMSFWNSAPISLKLRDCDKPGNLTPNDAYNFAVLPSVPTRPEVNHSSFLECPCPALFASWQPRASGEAVAFTNLKRCITSHAKTCIHAILFRTTGLSQVTPSQGQGEFCECCRIVGQLPLLRGSMSTLALGSH